MASDDISPEIRAKLKTGYAIDDPEKLYGFFEWYVQMPDATAAYEVRKIIHDAILLDPDNAKERLIDRCKRRVDGVNSELAVYPNDPDLTKKLERYRATQKEIEIWEDIEPLMDVGEKIAETVKTSLIRSLPILCGSSGCYEGVYSAASLFASKVADYLENAGATLPSTVLKEESDKHRKLSNDSADWRSSQANLIWVTSGPYDRRGGEVFYDRKIENAPDSTSYDHDEIQRKKTGFITELHKQMKPVIAGYKESEVANLREFGEKLEQIVAEVSE